MRIGGPPQRTVHPTDIALLAARVADIAKRLCGVETWRKLMQGNAEDNADDLLKLRECLDAQAETIAAQAERIVRLELMLGVAIHPKGCGGMTPMLPCPKCNARGHMDDSHDMDNGYGRWWRSEPTKCDWCAGKGAAAARLIAAKMVSKLEPELAAMESRMLDTRIELENYRALLGET